VRLENSTKKVHIFKSETRLAEFLMKENKNPFGKYFTSKEFTDTLYYTNLPKPNPK